jgi:macrolide transport system ATP-binding/permease protein
MTTAAIELRDIFYSYEMGDRRLPVLQGISLSVQPGELVAICGPSGSGKSTFLYIMGCLLTPDRGQIFINGVDTATLDPLALASLRNHSIGFVFQQFHLLPRTSVVENILLPARYPIETAGPEDLDAGRARELASRFGLGDHLDKAPNQLSGGQQQRVAIARSLMRDAQIILADEPTGNLDSASADHVMRTLKELNRQGRTVVIITHSAEIAQECDRVITIRDGFLLRDEHKEAASLSKETGFSSDLTHLEAGQEQTAKGGVVTSLRAMSSPTTASQSHSAAHLRLREKANFWRAVAKIAVSSLAVAIANLRRNRVRSALTMLGVTVGIAAVLAMITLGQFIKTKILESYAELGVNTIQMYAHPNWNMSAKDAVGVMFQQLEWERDLTPLKRVFPQVDRISPVLIDWGSAVSYGGRKIESDVRTWGVGAEAFQITRRPLLAGRVFDADHVRRKSAVCVIGVEIGEQLFRQTSPLGKLLEITSQGGTSTTCRILGVFASQTSNSDWQKPNLQVWMPYTFAQATSSSYWNSQIHQTLIEIKPGNDVELSSQMLKAFYEKRYGNTGRFNVNSDSKLLAQMSRFLSLFTVLLAAIALVCLIVGGIGIANMMLVSVSERLKEIGLRKALGATDLSIRVQFLTESVVLCLGAGLLGIIVGFLAYEGAISIATNFVKQMKFEWVVDPFAVAISLVAIICVGVFSGLVPALKAERLQVIEALRTE